MNTSWKGFLPRHAIIMTRRIQAQNSLPSLPTQEVQIESGPVILSAGNPSAKLIWIGEGSEENREEKAFQGETGNLLHRMIEAIHLDRDRVYLIQILKPSQPLKGWSLDSWIEKNQLAPQVILTLGEFATQTLLKTQEPLSQLRGQFHSYQNSAVMPTFDLQTLLQNPGAKRETWKDLQQVARLLGIVLESRKTG